MDDRLVAVGEDDVVELEVARDPADLGGVRLVGDVVLGVEHGGDLRHRGARRLHLAVELRELLQRLEDELQHPDGRDERADLERASVDQLGAGEEHGDGRDHAEQLDRREEDRRQLLRVDVGDPVRLVEVAELALECALAVEGLDDGHSGDGLGQLRRHGRDARPDVGEGDVRRRLEPPGHEHAGRQHDQCDHAEAPVEQEEAADSREQRQRVDDERRQALVEHVRQRVDVARQARDDPARLLLREVAQRERGEVVEEVPAQLEHDPLPDSGQHEPGRRAEHPGRQAHGDVGDDVEGEAFLVVSLDPVVDRVADDRPAEHGRGRGDRGDHHHDRDPPPAAAGVAPEARQAGAPLRLQVPRLRTAR